MHRDSKAQNPKKRHTGLAVFLCIVFLLLAVLGGVAWRYRAGIAVLLDNFGKSPEQVSSEREDYEKKTQDLLDRLSGGSVSLSALSEADRLRLKSGELTPTEAVAIIMGLAAATDASVATDVVTAEHTDWEATSPVSSVPPVPPGGTRELPAETTTATTAAAVTTVTATTAAVTTTVQTTYNTVGSAVQTIIAEMYLLRAEYINKLDDAVKEALDEINAISKDKRTMTVKLEMINRYLARGEALEAECDARMEELLSAMAAQLAADGSDPSLTDEARALYAQEKKLYKTELYNKYVGNSGKSM